MHSSIIFSTIFTAVTIAAPTANGDVNIVARSPAIAELNASAKAAMDAKAAAGCNILKCIAALAPTSITCAAALAQEGLNPIADAACFASALNTIANPPAACAKCGD